MSKKPIILDMDPGIDDALALSIVLNNKELDLKSVTSVAGNVTLDHTTENILKLFNFFSIDRKNIPVGVGAKKPLKKELEEVTQVHGQTGMDGYDFNYSFTEIDELPVAVELMYNTLKNSSGKITVVSTGSYTNIANLLIKHPDIKEKIESFVLMGGALYGGNMTSVAEFNVFTDPDAASIVFQSGLPITMIGLDVTLKAVLSSKDVKEISEINESGKMLASLLDHYNDSRSNNEKPVHDVNTIFYLLHPEMITTKDFWIDVATEGPAIGATVADVRAAYHDGKTNASIGVDINKKEFISWLKENVKNMNR